MISDYNKLDDIIYELLNQDNSITNEDDIIKNKDDSMTNEKDSIKKDDNIIFDDNKLDNIIDELLEKDNIINDNTVKSIQDLIKSSIKWIFLSGKGGVGKTTCSSCVGIRYSQELLKDNKKVLIVSTDPAHNLSDSFSKQFKDEPTLVEGFENLYCMEYDNKKGIEKAQQEFLNKVKLKEEQQNFNKQHFMEIGSLFQNMPGVDEALGFLHLIKEINKMDYDKIIFDTAPTGHTSKLLSYPQILKKSYEDMINKPMGQMFSLFMKNSIQQGENKLTKMITRIDDLNDKLTNPDYTTFICVGIPEFLSVYENERFIHDLFEKNIDVKGVIINQIIEEKECVNDFWKKRKQMQDKYVKLVKELYGDDFFLTYTYLKQEEIRGVDKLKEFTKSLFENELNCENKEIET